MDAYALLKANQRHIDEGIRRDEEAILSLKHQRNTFSPINTLPPELICRVLRFATFPDQCAGWTGDIDYCHLDSPGPPSWIQQVTHVCRHWRNLALNAPEIWTEPPLRNQKWTELMLKRSRMADISINVSASACALNIGTVKSVMAHETRIGQLRLIGIVKGDYLALKNHWPKSTPNIHTIIILVLPGARADWGAAESLPSMSFADSHQLRSVYFGNIAVDWNLSIFANLTEVRVCGELHHEHPTNVNSDLRRALKNMPHLVELVLDGILPRLEGPPNFTTIPLVKLRRLTVRGRGESVAAILQMLMYPPLDNLDLHFWGNVDHLDKMLTHMAPQFSLQPTHCPMSDITRLRLLGDFLPMSLAMEGSFLSPKESDSWTETVVIKLHFQPRTPRETSHQLELNRGLKIMLPTIPLHQITAFYASELDWSVDDWLELSSVLHQVESVQVIGSCCKLFTEALMKYTRTRPANVEGTPSDSMPLSPFVKLRKLTIESTNFRTELDINTLVHVLIHRKQLGLDIHKLEIFECRNIYLYDVNRLKEIVRNVEWDGEGWSSDSDDSD